MEAADKQGGCAAAHTLTTPQGVCERRHQLPTLL